MLSLLITLVLLPPPIDSARVRSDWNFSARRLHQFIYDVRVHIMICGDFFISYTGSENKFAAIMKKNSSYSLDKVAKKYFIATET